MRPKIAIFYDWLNHNFGGGETVLLDILNIFPNATLFTLIYNPQKTSWLPNKIKVVTSFINDLPFSSGNPVFYTPLYDIALEQFNFSDYDIIISTTSVIGHCLLTQPKTLFITYFHNINRHLYSKPYLNYYQQIDKIYSKRPDYLFCNSQTVQKRIFNTYQRNAKIIYPGIDTQFYTPNHLAPKEYFLVVGRLVAHKKFDLAIQACGQLGINLKIVGTGRDYQYLKLLSQQYRTVEFLGNVDNLTLKHLYQNSLALICPQIEDFGLTPIEIQACGRPVIAYNKGGITETVINNRTGLLFNNQEVDSLKKTLKQFYKSSFSVSNCRQQSIKFSKTTFMLNFKKQIEILWRKHLTTLS